MKGKESAINTATGIMMDFARSSGLFPPGGAPERYLWTDAFGVCNFLGLFRETGDQRFRDLAFSLIEQTHHVLGRHRPDDRRTGWISGLGEEEGNAHPTAGGLRIGKKLKERRPGEPFDERMEWDRDGQYYHYLTKWMHALSRTTAVTGEVRFNRWALELARISNERFVYEPPRGGSKRMAWKMSIDLSHPLVPHMGQHDPLDGLIVYTEIEATGLADTEGQVDLRGEIAVLTEMCKANAWVTDDPLGLGSLLSDAYDVAQLMTRGYFLSKDLLPTLLEIAGKGLKAFVAQSPLEEPADYRLPFRELGLSAGLRGVRKLESFTKQNPAVFEKIAGVDSGIEALVGYAPIAEKIEEFWLESEHQLVEAWTEHRNINMVTLATSLLPDGYLDLF